MLLGNKQFFSPEDAGGAAVATAPPPAAPAASPPASSPAETTANQIADDQIGGGADNSKLESRAKKSEFRLTDNEKKILAEGRPATTAPTAPAGQQPATQPGQQPAATTETADDADLHEITAEQRAFAKSYGMSDADVDLFGSPDELQRQLLIFDRNLANHARSLAQNPAAQLGPQHGQQVTAAEAALQQQLAAQRQQPSAGNVAPPATGFVADFGTDESVYDPNVVKNFRGVQGHLQLLEQQWAQRFQMIEQHLVAENTRQHQAAVQKEISQFDALCDGLAIKDLLGEDSKALTKEQAANRAKVWQEMYALRTGYLASGIDARMNKDFVKRAYQLAFQEHVIQQHRRQISDRLRKQAGRRTYGTGSQTPPPLEAKGETEAQRLANNPKLVAAWNDITRENKG